MSLRQNGVPVEIALSGCVITRAPYQAGGKWYARFDATAAAGRDELRAVDAQIQRLAAPRYSPVRFVGNVVAKIQSLQAMEFPGDIVPGQVVDLVVSPGPFGAFGWCLNVKRILREGACLAST